MSTIQPKRLINTIATDKLFRLRALIYQMASEGFELPGIYHLIGNEYKHEDIGRVYRKRNTLPRYIHGGRE